MVLAPQCHKYAVLLLDRFRFAPTVRNMDSSVLSGRRTIQLFSRRLVGAALVALAAPLLFAGTAQAATPVASFNDNVVTSGLNNGSSEVSVNQVIQDSAGGYLVVGDFITPSTGLARFNSDGTPDVAFNTAVGESLNPAGRDSVVAQAIEIDSNGAIYIAGNFVDINSSAYAISRFSSTGVLNTAFRVNAIAAAVSSGLTSGQVLGHQSSGKIILAGDAAGNLEPVLRLETDGSLDTGFAGSVTGRIIYAMKVQGDDKIVVGGNFVAPAVNLARLNADGTSDASFNTNVGSTFDLMVKAIAIDTVNSKILVGGRFSTPAYGLARLNSAGVPDSSFNTHVGQTISSSTFGSVISADDVQAVAVTSAGEVVVAGDFTAPAAHLARFGTTGIPDATFNASSGLDMGGTILSFLMLPNNTFVVGGYRIGGVSNSLVDFAMLRVDQSVTFDKNAASATGVMAPQYSYVAANLTANTFVRSGFVFGGWSTTPGYGTPTYANGASYAFSADTTLFATWNAVVAGPAPAEPPTPSVPSAPSSPVATVAVAQVAVAPAPPALVIAPAQTVPGSAKPGVMTVAKSISKSKMGIGIIAGSKFTVDITGAQPRCSVKVWTPGSTVVAKVGATGKAQATLKAPAKRGSWAVTAHTAGDGCSPVVSKSFIQVK